jgi:hypothetical protein
MGKLRRGGYLFVSWIGDHPGGSRHVHVFRDGRLIVKWDLDHDRALEGRPTRRILALIAELRLEGRL